ncbi:Stage IV sporulation protein FB [Lacunisphaera limnophila]|uniref:Stage IV sporulation protein FB n=1 Tax=Lacunisphaera limnophila TaxID=1838286 RepID=A0A1D8AY64_9BACT|nr:site-2 protease family protein [Lacunisphaera limnophila]AOS45827.1 Stage IV sporulation protein FB [Lacunisphaera limnophila]
MLGWSINLFRVFGIQLAVHASFGLLLAYYGWQGWQYGGLIGMLWSVALIVLFFGCVVLHELGHSLTARRYGVRVPRILLLPIGGMAEMEQIPRRPAAELLITVAGPAVNFALVLLLLPLVWQPLLGQVPVMEFSATDMLVQLWWGNLVMGTFNLLPVFPMDGGRIFRALLAMRLPYMRASWWAVQVGRVLALVFAGVAVFVYDSPLAGVLFVFIFMAAGTEYRNLLRREQEDAYWAEVARRATPVTPLEADPLPPLLPQRPD